MRADATEMTTLVPAWVDGALAPVEKLEVHQRGLRHKAVSVFVFCQGETLIQQRAAQKYHTPGLWANACCTHPAWDEDDAACAARRLYQELGLTGLQLDPRGTVEYRADVGGGLVEHERVALFAATATDRPVPKPDASEVAATRWISLAGLRHEIATAPDQFTPWLRIYMERHGDLIAAG